MLVRVRDCLLQNFAHKKGMTQMIELPFWLFILMVLFATVTALSHFLLPSVRWFFRRRFERAVKRLNERLTRPLEPLKLARRYDMIQRLVYHPSVTEAVVSHAAQNGVPENVAFQKAQRYAREIVPSFSAFVYFGFGIRVARFLANTLYDVRTGPDNDRVLKDVPPEATVVFVMNHRSNMDYVLVTYLAARASALSYAVGEWARVWPLSRLIKNMGAYFIRRGSGGGLYRAVLGRYVHMATAGGVTQAVFPEGGLSLTGHVMPPKLGIMSYIAEAAQHQGRDVVFVPVAINYDRVLEDEILISARQKGTRRFRARLLLVLLFILRKGLYRLVGRHIRFGTANVIFADPVMLSSFGPQPDVTEVASDLMKRIEGQMPTAFVPLLARAVLQNSGFQTYVGLQAAMLDQAKAAHSPNRVTSNEIKAYFRRACRQMSDRDMLLPRPGGWAPNPAKIELLQFYANSIAHYYPVAMEQSVPEDAAAAKS